MGVEPNDARKLKGVAIVELDTSYAGMMGCGSFERGKVSGYECERDGGREGEKR